MSLLGATRWTCGRTTRRAGGMTQCATETNHVPVTGPRGGRAPGASTGLPAGGMGAGPYSTANTYAWCRAESTAIVFAPATVGTEARTVYRSGAS